MRYYCHETLCNTYGVFDSKIAGAHLPTPERCKKYLAPFLSVSGSDLRALRGTTNLIAVITRSRIPIAIEKWIALKIASVTVPHFLYAEMRRSEQSDYNTDKRITKVCVTSLHTRKCIPAFLLS